MDGDCKNVQHQIWSGLSEATIPKPWTSGSDFLSQLDNSSYMASTRSFKQLSVNLALDGTMWSNCQLQRKRFGRAILRYFHS